MLRAKNGITPFLGRQANTRHTEITCDQCGAPFTPSVVERPIPDGAVRIEMPCPHCGARYAVAHITETGVRLRARLSRLARLGLMRTPQYQVIHDRYRKQVTPLTNGSLQPIDGKSKGDRRRKRTRRSQ